MVCLQDAILFLEETQNKKMCGLPCTSKGTIGGKKREEQGGGRNHQHSSDLWEPALSWGILAFCSVAGKWELSPLHFPLGRCGLCCEPGWGRSGVRHGSFIYCYSLAKQRTQVQKVKSRVSAEDALYCTWNSAMHRAGAGVVFLFLFLFFM